MLEEKSCKSIKSPHSTTILNPHPFHTSAITSTSSHSTLKTQFPPNQQKCSSQPPSLPRSSQPSPSLPQKQKLQTRAHSTSSRPSHQTPLQDTKPALLLPASPLVVLIPLLTSAISLTSSSALMPTFLESARIWLRIERSAVSDDPLIKVLEQCLIWCFRFPW
jgi:hypothetical protein